MDFAAHAAALGAASEKVPDLAGLEAAMVRAKAADKSYVITLDTDPFATSEGGCWWDVAVPEVSSREQVQQCRDAYLVSKKDQPY